MSLRQIGSLFIGIGIPFLAIFGVVPFIAAADVSVLGFPILYFWIFLLFPLTTLCLCVSWHFFDRHQYEDEQI
ncbi:DUF3311 domain-containing protein [Pseudobacillus wudalianchiensis]|uniref:DUF3311 domain-containing protein n=1 Tax=Pseudobacillus wudalianchiensis TaxID=1743143 RepID=A0A1B9B8D7_9BACI|nr:DUF3311 domain-containing protein [Bacillus wudalianchiensis]OCA92347.1 hypothetical protein A8F95_01110 [Bacillus wudalianchiensis]